MPRVKVWKRLLGVERTVIEEITWDDYEGVLVAHVRPTARHRNRCSRCGRRRRGYDQGSGRRRWRGLDLGTVRVFLEADAPRVECVSCGVVVAQVPWARPRSGFTRPFEDQVAWLAVQASKKAVAELMRIAWRSVGAIIIRVTNEAAAGRDPYAHLRFLGIDEISHRRGQQYITVVVDHETGQLIWAKPGRSKDTVRAFFDDLGVERAHQLEAVSADGATWITDVVAERAPQATICCDPFHIVSWATDALDEVRRQVWNDLRRGGDDAAAKRLKGARWALWKNPENLSGRQQQRLAEIQRTNRSLYRAYLLKEALRAVLQEPATAAVELLDAWLAWASRSKLPSFVKLARTIRAYRPSIEAAIDLRLSNALVESVNQRLRLVMRRGFGFHSAEAVIALGMLSLGGLCPPLPGRQPTHEHVS